MHLFVPAFPPSRVLKQAVRAFAMCWKRDVRAVQQSGEAQGGARLGSLPRGVALLIAGHVYDM